MSIYNVNKLSSTRFDTKNVYICAVLTTNTYMGRAGNISMGMMRSYSSAFSRRVFSDIINYGDFSHLNYLIESYSPKVKQDDTYLVLLKQLYKSMCKNYRCEYVYKNEIINKLLLKQFAGTQTIAFNEFRVVDSIVDLAMFNGVSKAFEIKTEYDSKKRLSRQLDTYSKLFQECYLVIPEELFDHYTTDISDNIGIVVMYIEKGHIKLRTAREAIKNTVVDPDILIRSVRCEEYKNIIKEHFGSIPEVSCYEMFDVCKELMYQIPSNELHRLFLKEIKRRANNTKLLQKIPAEIRQMCLSLNLNQRQSEVLLNKLNTHIITL